MTMFFCREKLRTQTSEWNSEKPWALSSFPTLAAICCPSLRTPSGTQPYLPSPSKLSFEKLYVASYKSEKQNFIDAFVFNSVLVLQPGQRIGAYEDFGRNTYLFCFWITREVMERVDSPLMLSLRNKIKILTSLQTKN